MSTEVAPAARDRPPRYVVIVVDLLAREVDAFGPLSRAVADTLAERVRVDLRGHGLDGVAVAVVALHPPEPDGSLTGR